MVAHFHYVLIGGMVFPLFGAFYYWLPKMTGRLLDERLGRWNFWTMFVGFNLTFFPMHIAGLLGMPRRYYTFLPGLGFEIPNLLSTIGAYLLAVGILLFVANWLWSLRSGEEAGPNPWDGSTLEWATPSPPPVFNFRLIPTVRSGNPLWEERSSVHANPHGEGSEHLAAVPPKHPGEAVLTDPAAAACPTSSTKAAASPTPTRARRS